MGTLYLYILIYLYSLTYGDMNVITHLTCGDIIFVHIDSFIIPDLWGHDHDMNVITYSTKLVDKNITILLQFNND